MLYLLEGRIVSSGIADLAVVLKNDFEVVLVLFRYVLEVELIWIGGFILVRLFWVVIELCSDFLRRAWLWRIVI